MDDLGKQMRDFVRKVERNLQDLPLQAASIAQNFFIDSFNKQGWSGEVQEPWKHRKNNVDPGRAILVKRARLKRSIRIREANWRVIRIGSDLPYASVHNDGFRGVETVRQHYRISARRVATSYKSNGRARKGRGKKIRGRGHEVRSFTRMMNIPRRRFMGNSPFLNARIERMIINRLNRL